MASKLPKLTAKSVRVYVAQRDIDAAVKLKKAYGYAFQPYSCCPISKALKRRFSNISGTGTDTVDALGKVYLLCNKGINFIKNFDVGTPVKPFHLYLTKQIG